MKLKSQSANAAKPSYHNQDVLDAALRDDLVAFVEKAFEEINGADSYLPNWHIEVACDFLLQTLMPVEEGGVLRAAIFIPPRHLKSIMASVGFVAWALGHNPKLRLVVVSHSYDLSAKLHRQFRQIVESDWYQRIFPAMRPPWAKNTETEFETLAGGGRLAISIGMSITGRGGDVILIDDPMKAELADNEAEQEKILTYFQQSLSTRLNNKKTGRMILIMQRLSVGDLGAHILENPNWTYLSLPAIAERDEEHVLWNGKVFTRAKGEALHPAHEDLKVFDGLKHDLGSRGFAAQYQQEPVPLGGGLLKLEWFKRWTELPPKNEWELVLHSWDCAASEDDGADYSVIQKWVVHKGNMYLAGQVRRKVLYPALENLALHLIEQHPPDHVVIEYTNTGRVLAERLFNYFSYSDRSKKVQAYRPKLSKEDRANAASPFIEAGHVYIPAEAGFLPQFEAEVRAFPKAVHDDQVDAMSQAIWFYQKAYLYAYKPKAYILGGLAIYS